MIRLTKRRSSHQLTDVPRERKKRFKSDNIANLRQKMLKPMPKSIREEMRKQFSELNIVASTNADVTNVSSDDNRGKNWNWRGIRIKLVFACGTSSLYLSKHNCFKFKFGRNYEKLGISYSVCNKLLRNSRFLFTIGLLFVDGNARIATTKDVTSPFLGFSGDALASENSVDENSSTKNGKLIIKIRCPFNKTI